MIQDEPGKAMIQAALCIDKMVDKYADPWRKLPRLQRVAAISFALAEILKPEREAAARLETLCREIIAAYPCSFASVGSACDGNCMTSRLTDALAAYHAARG